MDKEKKKEAVGCLFLSLTIPGLLVFSPSLSFFTKTSPALYRMSERSSSSLERHGHRSLHARSTKFFLALHGGPTSPSLPAQRHTPPLQRHQVEAYPELMYGRRQKERKRLERVCTWTEREREREEVEQKKESAYLKTARQRISPQTGETSRTPEDLLP